MVVTANTTKYTSESDLTKKEKKEKKQTNTQPYGMYLSKKDQLVVKQDMFIRHIMAKTVYNEENMFLNFNYILSDLSPVYSIQPVVNPV